jgi:hypothetical protein
MIGGPKEDYDMDQEYYEEQKIGAHGPGQRGVYEDYENEIIHKGSHKEQKHSKKASRTKGKNMYKTVDQT